MIMEREVLFNTSKFINEIKEQPAIYDIYYDGYNDKHAKLIAWDKVCEAMISKWQSLPEKDKNIQGRILRGKWRNIRDYFIKEYKFQCSLILDSGIKRKRKKYLYYDQLLFLLPSVEQRQITKKENQLLLKGNDVNSNSSDENTTCKEGNFKQEGAGSSSQMDIVECPQTSKYLPVKLIKSVAKSPVTYMDSSGITDINIINNGNQKVQGTTVQEENYDRMFLLSLLPMMQMVPGDKKLEVRIKMQQLLATTLQKSS